MKKILITMSLTIVSLLLLGITSYASVGIVPSTSVYTDISISDAYAACQSMKDTTLRF